MKKLIPGKLYKIAPKINNNNQFQSQNDCDFYYSRAVEYGYSDIPMFFLGNSLLYKGYYTFLGPKNAFLHFYKQLIDFEIFNKKGI